MEFLFDHYKKIKDPTLYLHNPDMKPISAIKARNRNFVLRFNDLSELTFEAPKYEKSKDGTMFELPYYSRLATKRLIKIDEIGWFQITQAIETEDGVTSYKSITAQSHQCAFREKGFFCEGRVYKFYDETDPYDSKYDSTKKDSIPSVVGQLYQQLGIKVAIAPTEFEPTEDYGEWTIIWVDKTLHYTNGSQQNICRSFKENSASYAYDFMVNTVENAFEVVFDFDFMHHAIKVKRVEDITQRTNIYLSFDNVVNELQTTEKADDIVTVLNCSGTDLDIRTVNPTGTNYIVDFSYYMDEANYHWMSKELIDKLKNWKALVDSNKDMYSGLISELRDVYEAHTELSSEIIYVRKKVQDLEAVRDQFSLKTVSGDAIFQAESFDVIYDWVQPASEEAGYDTGDIVMYKGATYKSLKGKNISEPNKSDWKLFDVRKSLDSGTSYATSHPRPSDSWLFSASQPTWNGSRFTSSTVVTNTLSGIITTWADVPDIYFIDGDSKTYCKVIRGSRVDVGTGAEIQYVASIERYTTYADISRWLTAWGKCDDTQQEAIDAYEVEAEEISASMQAIADATNILSYFKTTPSLLSELRHYWIEGDYNNDTLAVLDNTKPEEAIDLAKELLACGEKELSRVCQPRFSISVNSIKFIKIYEFRRFMYELALGKVITVEKSKDILYTPALTQMSFSLETGDDTFELVFSNALKLNDWGYTFADLIASASNTSKNVISNWNELMDYSAHKDSIQELLLNPLDTTLRLAEKNMSNQEFVVDRTGILGRKRKSEDLFEKEQVRMINNVILFTDDSWQTVKTALGKVAYTDYDGDGTPIEKQAYGLLAEVIVGSLMLGNQLKIANEGGYITLDQSGITIKNRQSKETVFQANITGDAYFYGDVSVRSLISNNNTFEIDEDGNVTCSNITITGGVIQSAGFDTDEKRESVSGNVVDTPKNPTKILQPSEGTTGHFSYIMRGTFTVDSADQLTDAAIGQVRYKYNGNITSGSFTNAVVTFSGNVVTYECVLTTSAILFNTMSGLYPTELSVVIIWGGYKVTGFTCTSGAKIDLSDSPYIVFPNFTVDADGILTATGATIEGTINAIDGMIGAFEITDDGLRSEYIYLNSTEVYFPQQAQLNLNNKVRIYTATPTGGSPTSYIATVNDTDFIIQNNSGAGIRFAKDDTTTTVDVVLTVTGPNVAGDGGGISYRNEHTKGSSYYYEAWWDYTCSINMLLSYPLTVTFKMQCFDVWHQENIVKTVTCTIPAYQTSATGSLLIDADATYTPAMTQYVYVPDNEYITTGMGFTSISKVNQITKSVDKFSATNNSLYSLGHFLPSSVNCTLGSSASVWGSLHIRSATQSSSDARLKNSISELSDDLSALFDLIKPVTYKFNDGTSDRTHIGFIAQDIEQSLKTLGIDTKDFAALCIPKEEDAYMSIRYTEFIPLNTWEIQKLKARVAELEKEIKELKGET